MTRFTTPHSPTLWSTLAEIWDISRAVWADYRDTARAARRRARQDRQYALSTVTPAWHNDVLFLGTVALAVVCAVLTAADGWGVLLDFLARVGDQL